MTEKITILMRGNKKQRFKKSAIRLEDMIEKEAPDMYEFIYGVDEEDIIVQVDKCRPEIVFIGQDDLELLKKIKQLHTLVAVFVFMLDILDDEQEAIDKYMAYGAYKCCLPPLMIDTLVHDMHVALNLE